MSTDDSLFVLLPEGERPPDKMRGQYRDMLVRRAQDRRRMPIDSGPLDHLRLKNRRNLRTWKRRWRVVKFVEAMRARGITFDQLAKNLDAARRALGELLPKLRPFVDELRE